MEKTLVLIKPDAVERNIIGEIISYYEKRGLKVIGIKTIKADISTAQAHYKEHKGKSFFDKLINYITRGRLCVLMLEGEDAVAKVRMFNGNTDPAKAEKNTIRGMYGISKTENTVHASDSIESVQREMNIWFPECCI
jgi:nucleoside-diphosphate kinase